MFIIRAVRAGNSNRRQKLELMVKFVGAATAATAVICNVVVALPPRPSETVTVKLFRPKSLEVGVPFKAPLAATESQAGPAAFANVNGSLFGSVALPESVSK
jgi:hypothetical protein